MFVMMVMLVVQALALQSITVHSIPLFQVDHERLLAVASTGRARDLLHVVSLHS